MLPTRVGAGSVATDSPTSHPASDTESHSMPTWKIAIIACVGVCVLVFIAAVAFFLIRRRRQKAKYRNITKPQVGEARENFKTRVSESADDEEDPLAGPSQARGDYTHPYTKQDTAYLGPKKTPEQGP